MVLAPVFLDGKVKSLLDFYYKAHASRILCLSQTTVLKVVNFFFLLNKFVSLSLQRIPQFPADDRTIQVFGTCDDFMSTLMTELGHEIPPFTLKRRARINVDTKKDGSVQMTVTGLDRDEDLPYSFIKVLYGTSLN